MARLMIDLALDDTEDLTITGGDFTITESTARHQEQLILNNKGDFKQNPSIGVGAASFIDDENTNELLRALSIEFIKDGMDVLSVRLERGVVYTDAFYR